MPKNKHDHAHWPADGRCRVVIEEVTPEMNAGAFPVKRSVGEQVVVEADAYADGHDAVACVLRQRREPDGDWQEVEMRPLGNDRWRAAFSVSQIGYYRYTVSAWIDRFETWRRDLRKRVEVNQDSELHYQVGAGLIAAAAKRADGADAEQLKTAAHQLAAKGEPSEKRAIAQDAALAQCMRRHDPRTQASHYERELRVRVERERARFSAWYEFFPRSTGADNHHGTWQDALARLDDIAKMGFDVVYLPPIHPIGRAFRKGKNNALEAAADDVGSPWAIGAKEGGHKSVHPELGSLDDFRRFRQRAETLGLDVALDIAFQCAPDHPYVSEHPGWFRQRPDGSIQYAENPPKKYQDIYPFDFETEDWRALWVELEEYLDSEKYQLRNWPLTRADSLKDLMMRLNRVRRENPALQSDRSLKFHRISNEHLLCYSKRTADLSNIIVVVINLDPHHTQSGWLELPITDLGLNATDPYQVQDLLSGAHYIWYGSRNFVQIDPHSLPGHIFRVRRHVRSEHDFDYYL